MDLEGYENVPIDYKKSDWKMDPKGYFLIDIDRKGNLILVAHHFADGKKNKLFTGSDPIALYYTVLKNDIVSFPTHAAYLGQELEKAFLALKHGFKFVQDDVLYPTKSEEDVNTKAHEKVKWHRADDFAKMKKEEYGDDSGGQYH